MEITQDDILKSERLTKRVIAWFIDSKERFKFEASTKSKDSFYLYFVDDSICHETVKLRISSHFKSEDDNSDYYFYTHKKYNIDNELSKMMKWHLQEAINN